jgi:hypothetical protein
MTNEIYTVYTVSPGKQDQVEEFVNRHEAIGKAVSDLCKGDRSGELQTKIDPSGNYIFLTLDTVKYVEQVVTE